MATLFQPAATRQPFAPINGSRLQSLTSLKNRQNVLPTTLNTPSKRKAAVHDQSSYSDDENIDPAVFASPKRSKGQDGTNKSCFDFKPSAFILTKAPASSTNFSSITSPSKSLNLSRPMLQPRSPAPKLNIGTGGHNLSAPAGRSPTRKRIGILNRRRTASTSTFGTRVDPPAFGSAAAPPFSLAAALSGSIPASKPKALPAVIPASLDEPTTKEGWFFEIHEDTEEELSQNLMEHGACTLDISSDEERESRRSREERECGKENVAPWDDVSQTSSRPSRNGVNPSIDVAEASVTMSKAAARAIWRRREAVENGAIEIDRCPLGEMAAEEFFPEGVSASDVILVQEEEDEQEPEHKFEFTVEVGVDVKGKGRERILDFQHAEAGLLTSVAAPARILEPIEAAEDGWSVWESGSAKGDD